MKRNITTFLILGLAMGLVTSCSGDIGQIGNEPIIEPPYLPMFLFDDQGLPYLYEMPELSPEMQNDVCTQLVGYGWKWMQTNEIRPDGFVDPRDYYESMIGPSPSSYYFGPDGQLTRYFRSDANNRFVCHTQGYTLQPKTGLLHDSEQAFCLRIWTLYKWTNGKWYMSAIEPLCTRYDNQGVAHTVWGTSQYVRMTPQELQLMQEQAQPTRNAWPNARQ